MSEPWTDVDLARFRGVGHALRSLRVEGAAIVVQAADEMERRGQRIVELEAALAAERATSQRRLELLRPLAEFAKARDEHRKNIIGDVLPDDCPVADFGGTHIITIGACRAARKEVDRG